MRILFYDAKRYDIESFNGEKANYPQIELEYLETDLNVRTAKLAGGYDGICGFVSSNEGACDTERTFCSSALCRV